MDLDSLEISGLKDILKELDENIETYEKMKETGNCQGEHKDIYRGKYEAYSRSKVILLRYLKWHSIVKVDNDGDYHFLKNSKLSIPDIIKSLPLTGKRLEILEKTYNRLLSEEPTKL